MTRWNYLFLLLVLPALAACDKGIPWSSDAGSLPPAEAYFDDAGPASGRPHAIYPFLSEVPLWLDPNLVVDPDDGAVYDGLGGRGYLNRPALCTAAMDAPLILSKLPALEGKDVGVFCAGAVGYAFHLSALVGPEGTVTARDYSLLDLALVRAIQSVLQDGQGENIDVGLVMDQEVDIAPASLDAVILAHSTFLVLDPLPDPLENALARVSSALRPEGILAVVQHRQAQDAVWVDGDLEVDSGLANQHATLARLGFQLHKEMSVAGSSSAISLYARPEAGLDFSKLVPAGDVALYPPWVDQSTSVLCRGFGASVDDEDRLDPAEPLRLEFFRPGGLEESLSALPPLEGLEVAEIGAGFGYFAFPLARAVGPTGKLYAVDIDPLAIETMRLRMESNPDLAPPGVVQLRLGTQTNTLLPADSVDLAVSFQVVHLFGPAPPANGWGNLRAFIGNLRTILRPGGRFIAVVPHRPFAMRFLEQALQVYEEEGFNLVRHGPMPFNPPETVTGVAVWATCFDETVSSTLYEFVSPD